MNVTQVACAATAFYLWGWRGLVVELWVNVLVIAIADVWVKHHRKTTQ